MGTPLNNGHDDLRYAEYVLGVLDADARAAVEQDIENDPQAATTVHWWQQRLTPLSEDIAASAPPDVVWARIQDALGHQTGTAATAPPHSRDVPHPSLWNNLPLWRWLGIGGSLAAATCLVLAFVVTRPQPGAPTTTTTASYMVARIQQDNGVAGWTVTMDLERARMVVVPATPKPVASDRSTELWLIPPGQKPISLGLIADNHPTTVSLSQSQLKQLGTQALLAVSVEPHGGSPTGQPTGPVVAKGSISKALATPPRAG